MHRSHLLRRWATLLALLLLLPLLIACGGAPQTASPTTEARDTAEPATSRPATSAPTTDSPTETAGEPSETLVQNPDGTWPTLSTPKLEYGAVAHLYYTDRERALTLANNAGFGWIRQQIHWKDIEGPKGNFGWDELDAIVNAADAHDIKLLISIVRSPSWARADGSDGMPDNPKDLGDFVEVMAERYRGKVQAYEIWNEQNLAYENGGQVVPEDAGKYVELLIEAYSRIKAVDPSIYVVAGAPSSTGVSQPDIALDDMTYYRLMYEYKGGIIKGYFDVQGVHPGGAANPPGTLWPDNPSNAEGWTDHPTFYFRHLENVRAVMVEYGLGDHQMWITEFGWATENNTPNYEFGNQVTPEEQAQYVLDALKMTRADYPWVGAIFIWNLNFAVLWGEQGNPYHEQASFGLLNPDWSPRPVFNAFQGFINAVRAEEGG